MCGKPFLLDGARDFYSRPCGRGDADELLIVCVCLISTHAPAGGATRETTATAVLLTIFLLTPLREGRLAVLCICLNLLIFLLTPLREGRRVHRRRAVLCVLFLLTPLREGRRSGQVKQLAL